jgi:4-amino-4-deoxy-L-arabinose transferase-like glycosyltransferase
MEAKPEKRPVDLPPLATGVVSALAAVKLLLHLLTNSNYGYFIDELYYIACSEHLAFGYVDHPPMVAVVTWLTRALLGDSLPALRLFPALAGALTVVLAALIARELGGGRFAQLMAGLAVVICPLYLFMNTILSMNALDALLWTFAAWLVARIINRGRWCDTGGHWTLTMSQLWLLLGLVLGVGLENKISVLFFGFGLTVGLLLTSERRHLRTPWPWCGGGIALALFLPHLIWQMLHSWPTLEFIHNATVYKNRPLSVLDFLTVQFLDIHPLNFLLLLGGLVFFLITTTGKRYRLFGWMYL